MKPADKFRRPHGAAHSAGRARPGAHRNPRRRDEPDGCTDRERRLAGCNAGHVPDGARRRPGRHGTRGWAGRGPVRARDEVLGQLLIPPLGSTGTYAQYVACAEGAPLARIPAGLDPVTAAALPTVGVTGLVLAESLAPLDGKVVLIVGAAGGVGSFLTQFAAQAGAHVLAVAPAAEAERMRGYGAAETIDRTAMPLPEAVARTHPDGIDVLVDVASDAAQFAALAGHVRSGGTAVTTRYVADLETLARAGVTGVNFQLSMTVPLLDRLASSVAAGSIVPPPIARISLDDVPDLLGKPGHGEGKTVITI